MKLATGKQKQFSLTFQYALTIAALMSAGLLFLAAVMLHNQTQQNDRYTQDFGAIISKQLASASKDHFQSRETEKLNSLIERVILDEHFIGAAIYTNENLVVAQKGELPIADIDFSTRHYRLGNVWKLEPYMFIHNTPIMLGKEHVGYSVTVFSLHLLNEQFREQIYATLGTLAFILIIVVIVSVYQGNKMSAPIRHLVEAAEDIKEGRIDLIYDRRTDELGSLIDAINKMSQGLIRKTQVEQMLDRVLTRDVKDKVMDQLDTVEMAGEHVYATVLFADIVGFTSISEEMTPEDVQKLLKEYYSYFNACARFYFGTVDKYIGDCVMVVFGAPKVDPKHQYQAIACAVVMQKLAVRLNERRREQGLFPIELRIGINSGKMMAGLIGSDDRMEYTVVGDAVNLASRLCSEADGAQVIIEESLFDSVNPDHQLTVEAHKQIRVRGKKDHVTIYSVLDIAHDYQKVSDDLIEDILSQRIID